jgi:hypothetical protein
MHRYASGAALAAAAAFAQTATVPVDIAPAHPIDYFGRIEGGNR